MNDLLSTLNERQLDAATSTEGYLRVIAGAGSGKTKLLVSRYAYLVEEYGISPSNILCVTFTNKAAGEMKRRVRALIGGEYDTSLISTYHGFCVRVLREDIEKVFYPKEFTIIDKKEQKTILGEIYRKFELKLDHASFEKILDEIALYKAQNRSYVSRICARGDVPIMVPPVPTQNGRIIEEYMRRQKQLFAMDFSDLLYFTLDIFARCPEVLKKWQDRLNYIEVDEFQDSSRTEMELVDLISAKYKNVMIVGDPDQNIYEWRGSDVRLLVDFDRTHAQTKTVILDRNYRSTPEILKCANTLIEKNVNRLKKDLYTLSGSGAPVIHYHAKSESDEADRVVENIEALRREKGWGYGSFAVLYRSGFLSRVVEKKFNENAIPYEILGGVKFYQRMEVQDIAAYLRLIARDDDDAFRRIVNTPRRRFGRTRLLRVTELSESSGVPLFCTLRNNLDDPAFSGSGGAEFVALIDSLREYAATARISEIVGRALADSGYETYIRELGDMERFDNLSEFKRIAVEYEKSFGEDLTLDEFIRQIDLQAADGDDADDEGQRVKLMTIHSAKGLEFPCVFVVGFSEGIFPSSKTIEERKLLGLEEERRLCYVAITRARERLFLLDSEGTSGNGRVKTPSRFLFEIGEENYTRVGAIPKELRDATARVCAGMPDGEVSAGISVGEKVSHPAFGDGVVVGRDERRRTLRIKFDKLTETRDISEEFFIKARQKAASKYENAAQNALRNERTEARTPVRTDVLPNVHTDVLPDAPPQRIAATDAKSAFRVLTDSAEAAVRRAEEEKAANRAAAEAEASRRAAVMREMEASLKAAVDARRADAQSDSAAESDPSVAEADAILESNIEPVADADAPDEIIDDSLGDPFAELADELSYDPLDGEFFDPDLAAVAEEEADYTFDAEFEKEVESVEEETQIELPFTELLSPERAPRENVPHADASNLWDDPDVPKTGWTCTGVTDLGGPYGVCEMCGRQIIRYVHHMTHPAYRSLGGGCVCAGKMEGDIERARKREASFKNREARRKTFLARKWKISKNRNEYLKIKGHIIVLVEDRSRRGWKYSFDGTFCRETFKTRDDAVGAVFDELEKS